MKRSQLLGGGAALLLVATIFGLGILSARSDPGSTGALSQACCNAPADPTRAPREERAREERRAVVGERGREPGGEAGREGLGGPATEAIDSKAHPRSYVDDRRAVAGRRAFDRLPATAPARAFRTARAYRRARVAGPAGAWAELGPDTPWVAPQASQFFNLDTMTGTVTTNSGRVTAMAIAPICVPGDCRLWVAAAGGGIWRTNDALAEPVAWIPPPDSVPTTSFGSLLLDPNDPTHNTLYAGSGEPNGSGDSEAGLGLFKSTDGGATWALVPGSQPVAVNRSIGAIVTVPGDPATIYIGTALARHGSAAVNGGRRTPPDAPPLGVYRSRDGGATWTRVFSRPGNPAPPASGTDWFQGGVTRLELDPNDARTVYAALFGYGLWRSEQAGDPDTWQQIFHTINQNDFTDPAKPVGDTFGDRTEFDAVAVGSGRTRIYLGDASNDQVVAHVWRVDDAAAITGSPAGAYDNAAWQRLSSDVNGTNGFLAFNYCQNGQCGYDNVVVSPPGQPDTVWLGGAMNYDELPAYGQEPPRSSGRTVIRSTNAGAPAADVTWQDMTQDAQPPGKREGMHPDQHAIVFAAGGNIAFAGSDGGVIRADLAAPADISAECAARKFPYGGKKPTPLAKEDLVDCQRLLRAVPAKLTSLNDGLRTLQFQSLSYNPADPTGELLGGTQDNGTWAYTASASRTAPPPASQWFESVGGDGGLSAFDAGNPQIRYHTYFNATPDVNFHGNDPTKWLDIYDVLQDSKEQQSFYSPLIADPVTPGRAFIGLEHVWRTDDNGGPQAALEAHCNELTLDLDYTAKHPCGDWKPLGKTLTGTSFGADRAGQFVVAVERAPSDPSSLWAATRIGRLFISTNADAKPAKVKFRRLDSAATPGRFVSGIAIDPADPTHAWVSYSGYDAYTPDAPGHVFEVRYDPAARTVVFTNRSYNIGDQPVTDVAFDAATGDLYAATDFGVLRRPAGATSWEDAAPGLPHVAVYGIALAQKARVLYAATHGRGAYRLTLGVG